MARIVLVLAIVLAAAAQALALGGVGHLTVRVRDTDGNPPDHVCVLWRAEDGTRIVLDPTREPCTFAAALPAGKGHIEVAGAGVVPRRRAYTVAEGVRATIDFTATVLRPVAVAVRAPDGSPIAGALVRAREENRRLRRTGADGVAHFRLPLGVTTTVDVWKPGYEPASGVAFEVSGERWPYRCEVELHPWSLEITGVVRDRAGPATGVAVVLWDEDQTEAALATTDAEGRFRLPARTRGPARVSVGPPGAPTRSVPNVPAQIVEATPGKEIRLFYPSPPTVRIRLTAPAGRALPEVVRVSGSGRPGIRADVAVRDGEVALPMFVTGTASVGIEARGFVSAVFRVEIPEEREPPPVEVVLEPGARVRGRAVDRDGKPIGGAMVMCMRRKMGRGPLTLGETTTDHEGRFELRDVPVDSHILIAVDKLMRGGLEVTLDPDHVTDVGDIILERR